MVVHLAVAGDVFDGVLFCTVLFFSHELSWMEFGTELNRFLRIFLSTFFILIKVNKISNKNVLPTSGFPKNINANIPKPVRQDQFTRRYTYHLIDVMIKQVLLQCVSDQLESLCAVDHYLFWSCIR